MIENRDVFYFRPPTKKFSFNFQTNSDIRIDKQVEIILIYHTPHMLTGAY